MFFSFLIAYWQQLLRYGPILLCLLYGTMLQGQNSLNDCSGAIEVCGNGAISSNATGVGRQEIGSNACSSMEHHSLWIKIEVTRSGTLGFTLTPTSRNLEVDYDFFIFGPNVNCGNLGDAIRCSTTNPLASNQRDNLTGMNDAELDTSEGPGASGNSFVKSLNVLPGESYFIVIDRPIGTSPFDLEWTGTSTLEGSPFPEGVEVNQPNDLVECGISGSADFNIFSAGEQITSQPQTLIEYYAELAQAVDRVNELPSVYTSTIPRKTIFARVENLLTGCSQIVDFDLIIPPGPQIATQITVEGCDLDRDGIETFDLDALQQEILQDLSPKDHTIEFYRSLQEAQNGLAAVNSLQNSSGGTFFARVQKSDGSGCYSISSLALHLISPGNLAGLSTENLKIKVASKRISVPVTPGLDYAVNNPNGPYFTGPHLRDVPSGMNTLYIRNADLCEIGTLKILVPEFPAAFSPNNDGVNDNWFVSTGNYPVLNRPVRVFDRYGKLLWEFRVNAGNWDGTLNGYDMPADDYWFEFSLPENLVLRGHFSLIR